MVKYNEWLFYFDIFVEKLKNIGVELVSTGFLDEKSPKNSEFDGPSIFKILPTDGKVFSSLNRYFIFQRVKQPKKIKVPELDFDIGKAIGVDKKFSLYTPTKNKKSSFIEAVMCAVDKSCTLLSPGERERRVKVLRASMAAKLSDSLFEKLGRKGVIEDLKAELVNGDELPVTIYADILSRLLKVNILIVTDKGKYLEFDKERKMFGCYENTCIIYGKEDLYGVMRNEKSSCYKTKSTLVKEILKIIVNGKKMNK